MFWSEILTALALVLVIEGMLPFVRPGLYKRLIAQIAQVSDSQLRTYGLSAMIAGIFLLFFVRG